jgi:DNA adenine methylase
MTVPSRPALRYHGGKWLLAPWIISHFPSHRVYVEPFGGGGSVLMRKERSYAEIYNDLDVELVNLFRVLRDDGEALRDALRLTPFARGEYLASFAVIDSPLEQARRTVVRSFMGFGSNALQRSIKSGFRSNSNKSGTTPAHDWANYPDCMDALIERLQGVVIENRDALEVMVRHDGPDTLHYCDPPYVHETRMKTTHKHHHGYNHEMTNEQHCEFAAGLHQLSGMVVLSGYPCPLYDEILFSDWLRIERPALADGARPRIEVLWINRACQDALGLERAQHSLFSESASANNPPADTTMPQAGADAFVLHQSIGENA